MRAALQSHILLCVSPSKPWLLMHLIVGRSPRVVQLKKGVASVYCGRDPGSGATSAGSIGYAPLSLASQAHDVTILSIDGQDPHHSSLAQRDEDTFWNIEYMYTQGRRSLLAQSFLNYKYGDVVGNLPSRFGLLPLHDTPQGIRTTYVLEAA